MKKYLRPQRYRMRNQIANYKKNTTLPDPLRRESKYPSGAVVATGTLDSEHTILHIKDYGLQYTLTYSSS